MGHSRDDAVHKKSNKMKTHWPKWLKFLVLAYFKVFFRTRYKEIDVILVQCPFKVCKTKTKTKTKQKQKQKKKIKNHRHMSYFDCPYRKIDLCDLFPVLLECITCV